MVKHVTMNMAWMIMVLMKKKEKALLYIVKAELYVM